MWENNKETENVSAFVVLKCLGFFIESKLNTKEKVLVQCINDSIS